MTIEGALCERANFSLFLFLSCTLVCAVGEVKDVIEQCLEERGIERHTEREREREIVPQLLTHTEELLTL